MSNKVSNDFLPDDYETPALGGGYMKLKDGDNKLRILSKPIIGWLDWDDKKPLRFRMKFKPEKPIRADQAIKHFWAFIVYNYADKEVQILEITQATVQKAIEHLSKDEEWGAPYHYDIKITKTGKDKETKYAVVPSPKKALTDEQMSMALAKPCNLDALFSNDDPWKVEGGKQTELAFQGLPF